MKHSSPSAITRISVLVLTGVILSTTLTPSVTFAQTAIPLTVSPARTELELEPGAKKTVNVNFYNQGSEPVSGIIQAADFIVQDDQGTPVIIESPSQQSPRFSGASWVSLPYDRMSIAAQNKVSIPVSITVPPSARPGGRYVAIYFEPGTRTADSTGQPKEAGASITSRIVSLLYIKIAGDVFEKAMVSRLTAPAFSEYGPVMLSTEILNRGDYHIRPKGVVTLTNMFGTIVEQKTMDEQNIFPDTARSFEEEIGSQWMFGRYQIDLSAAYGEKGQGLRKVLYVWIFPWKIAVSIVVGLILLVVFAGVIKKRVYGRETALEEQVKKEQEEIEKLKQELKKRDQ